MCIIYFFIILEVIMTVNLRFCTRDEYLTVAREIRLSPEGELDKDSKAISILKNWVQNRPLAYPDLSCSVLTEVAYQFFEHHVFHFPEELNFSIKTIDHLRTIVLSDKSSKNLSDLIHKIYFVSLSSLAKFNIKSQEGEIIPIPLFIVRELEIFKRQMLVENQTINVKAVDLRRCVELMGWQLRAPELLKSKLDRFTPLELAEFLRVVSYFGFKELERTCLEIFELKIQCFYNASGIRNWLNAYKQLFFENNHPSIIEILSSHFFKFTDNSNLEHQDELIGFLIAKGDHGLAKIELAKLSAKGIGKNKGLDELTLIKQALALNCHKQVFHYCLTSPLKKEILEWLANMKDPLALTELGTQCDENENSRTPDMKRAVEYYRLAAEKGCVGAQARLGRALLMGKGIEKNEQEAFMWLSRATTMMNNPLARHYLGIYHFNRNNKEEAFSIWLNNKNFIESEKKVAQCFREGQGVTKNRYLALRWDLKGANRGDEEAKCECVIGLLELYFDSRSQNGYEWLFKEIMNTFSSSKDGAIEWLTNQAEEGNVKAIDYLKRGPQQEESINKELKKQQNLDEINHGSFGYCDISQYTTMCSPYEDGVLDESALNVLSNWIKNPLLSPNIKMKNTAEALCRFFEEHALRFPGEAHDTLFALDQQFDVCRSFKNKSLSKRLEHLIKAVYASYVEGERVRIKTVDGVTITIPLCLAKDIPPFRTILVGMDEEEKMIGDVNLDASRIQKCAELMGLQLKTPHYVNHLLNQLPLAELFELADVAFYLEINHLEQVIRLVIKSKFDKMKEDFSKEWIEAYKKYYFRQSGNPFLLGLLNDFLINFIQQASKYDKKDLITFLRGKGQNGLAKFELGQFLILRSQNEGNKPSAIEFKLLINEAIELNCLKEPFKLCLRAPINIKKYILQQLVDRSYPPALVELGKMFEKGEGFKQNMPQANLYFYKAAREGCPKAQALIGRNLLLGFGAKKDEESALKWLNEAAKMGNDVAQHYLGVYYYGRGEKEKALKLWLRNAWTVKESLEKVAQCYLEGDGVAKNIYEASRWYLILAKEGDRDAQVKYALIVEVLFKKDKGNEEDEYIDHEEIDEWLEAAISEGHVEAKYIRGFQYLEGNYDDSNKPQGMKYMQEVAESGYKDAQEYLEKHKSKVQKLHPRPTENDDSPEMKKQEFDPSVAERPSKKQKLGEG